MVEKALDGGQLEIEEVLANVEDELAAKRDRLAMVAVVHYRQKEIDPFIGDFMPPMDLNSPSAKEPATEAQIDALEKLGLSKPPPGLTKGEASQMLDAVIARTKAGLATIPQCRLLEKLGLDTRTMPKNRASELIGKLRAKGFKPWVVMHEPEARRGRKSS